MRVEAISQQPAEREQQEVRRREVAVKSAAACGIDQAGATHHRQRGACGQE